MATITTKPDSEGTVSSPSQSVPAWPRGEGEAHGSDHIQIRTDAETSHAHTPSQHDALQALIAFSALHEQVRKRKAIAGRLSGFDAGVLPAEFDKDEQFVLDEVLQLVAERAVAITGADGLAVALAENNEIVLRAAAGTVRPDVGARIDRDSAFSGACFRTAQIVTCDDTETDARVNLQACRKLGARSMVAVPLCGRRRVIGLIEAFSSWPFAFNDSDVRNLSLLAELVVGALKPEDEDRFAASAQVAASGLETPVKGESAAPPNTLGKTGVAAYETAKPVGSGLAKASTAEKKTEKTTAETSPLELSPAVTKSAVTTVEEPKPSSKLQEESAPGEPTAEPAIFSLPEESRRLPRAALALVAVVVVVAFVAGIWWKLKTSQLASVPMQTDKSAINPAPNQPEKKTDTSSDAADGVPLSMPATASDLAKFPRVTGVRQWSSADSTTIVLDLEDQVQYEAHRLAAPDRIYFDLHDTQLNTDLAGKTLDIGDALLNRVRVAQPVAGMTRMVLETKPDTNFSVSLEPNPYRLVVAVSKVGVTPKAAVNLFPGTTEQKLAIVVPPPTKEDLQLRARVARLKIVVDAGHGGWDLGTVGRRGLLEKDLVLEIAQRLDKLLESRLGAEVILTRNDDNYIPLDERADIANQAQADLFISVHANYSDLPSARGVETYYTNRFTAPGSKEIGSRNEDPHSASKNGIAPQLTQADLREKIDQSRRLAASVQRSLYGTLSAQNPGLRDRGIKEAGFVVLTESAMPGILAEVSFVSSPTDEQKLRSDGYREEIAEALYRGIARYAAGSKSVKMASAK